jgi:hypothetical protein
METRTAVLEFLKKFREAAEHPSKLILLWKHPGSANAETFLEFGMTEAEAKGEIFRLSVEDYSEGPQADRDREGQEVWLFVGKFWEKKFISSLFYDRRAHKSVVVSLSKASNETALWHQVEEGFHAAIALSEL